MAEALARHFPRLAPALGVVAIVLLMFVQVLTRGYVLDGNVDRRLTCYPTHLLARESLWEGRLPQWNPYIFCGTSFMFTSTNLSLYPPTWPAYCLPRKHLAMGLTIEVMVHMFLSGVFAYLLARRLGIERFWSACSAYAFMLSSTMIMNVGTEFHYYGLVLLPLILFLIHTQAERRLALNVGVLAITYALLFVSGGPQMILYVAAMCVTYSAWLVITNPGRERRYRPAIVNGLGMSLGVGMAAIKLLPFYYDTACFLRSRCDYLNFLETGLTPKECVLRLLMPHFFGSSIYPTTISAIMNHAFGKSLPTYMNNYETFTCYTGVGTTCLGLYAMLFVWNRGTWFWKAVIGAIMLTVLGTPMSYLHYLATGSTNIHFGRVMWLLPTCMCVLAGFAAMDVMRADDRTRRFLWFVIAVGVCALVASMMVSMKIASLDVGGIPHTAWENGARAHFLAVWLGLLALLGTVQFVKGQHRQAILRGGFLVLTLVDLLRIAHIDANSACPFLSPVEVFEPEQTNIRTALPDEIFARQRRVMTTMNGPLAASVNVVYGMYNAAGADVSSPGHICELFCYPEVPNRMESRTVWPRRQATQGRIFQVTSTRVVIDGNNAFNVPDSLPRWSLFDRYRLAANEDEEREFTVSQTTDIQREVVLNAPPDIEVGPLETPGNVRKILESSGELQLETVARGGALLVVTDTWFPGWRAFVDDKEVPIMRANAAFRAVAVPPGKHLVRFVFVHEGVATGAAWSLASLAGCAVLLAWDFVGRRAPSRNGLGSRSEFPGR